MIDSVAYNTSRAITDLCRPLIKVITTGLSNMVIASSHMESELDNDVKSIRVGDTVVDAVGSVRHIKAVLDSRLSKEEHVNRQTSSCYFNLRNISKVCRNLTHDATVTQRHALVI